MHDQRSEYTQRSLCMAVMHMQVCPDLARWTRIIKDELLDITPTAPTPSSSPTEEEGSGTVTSGDGVEEGEAATLSFTGVLCVHVCLLSSKRASDSTHLRISKVLQLPLQSTGAQSKSYCNCQLWAS